MWIRCCYVFSGKKKSIHVTATVIYEGAVSVTRKNMARNDISNVTAIQSDALQSL